MVESAARHALGSVDPRGLPSGGRPRVVMSALPLTCQSSPVMPGARAASGCPPVLTAALGYAAIGLRVIPLRPRTKVPCFRGWPRLATCEPEVLTRWLWRSPESNLGVVTGGGLIALDLDRGSGGLRSFARLTRGRDVPRTAEALTGNRGKHLLYRVPPGVAVRNAQGLLPGVDVRGERGLIAVEPSLHPKTGREYTWLVHPGQGIADAPTWLVEVLAGAGSWAPARKDRVRPGSPVRTNAAARAGGGEALLAEMIARFPVDRAGRRNDAMVRVLGSLLGRGYGEELAAAVTSAWWTYFSERGAIGTPTDQAGGDVAAAIRSILRSPDFTPARDAGGHRDACRSVRLAAWQTRLLRSGLGEWRGMVRGGPGPGREGAAVGGRGRSSSSCHDLSAAREGSPPNRKRLTLTCDPLCVSDDDQAFVAALAVHATYQRGHAPDDLVRVTDAQVLRIVADRVPGAQPWRPIQMERLKRKYLSRPGKPASRFELLRLVCQGRPGRGGAAGSPSVYEVTGLAILLDRSPDGGPRGGGVTTRGCPHDLPAGGGFRGAGPPGPRPPVSTPWRTPHPDAAPTGPSPDASSPTTPPQDTTATPPRTPPAGSTPSSSGPRCP